MDLQSRPRDHDRQAAEDKNSFLLAPGILPGSFIGNIIISSIKANPLKDGDAKPWVYNPASGITIARLPT